MLIKQGVSVLWEVQEKRLRFTVKMERDCIRFEFAEGVKILPKLVIIRGNSGSGKTTIAKTLQHTLGHNIMLLSQDVIRRDLLRVKDGADTKVLPLLSELLVYGREHCEIVILEGILYSEWYLPLFEFAKTIFGNQIWGYYYDLSFEETLARHGTKNNRNEFGEEEMKEWWHEKDFIKIIPEKIISEEMSLKSTVEMIIDDISD